MNIINTKNSCFILFFFFLTNSAFGSCDHSLDHMVSLSSRTHILELFKDLSKPKKVIHLEKISRSHDISLDEKIEIFKEFDRIYSKDKGSDSKEACKKFMEGLREDTRLKIKHKGFIASTYNSWGKAFENDRVQALVSIFKDIESGPGKKKLVSKKLGQLGRSELVSILWKEDNQRNTQEKIQTVSPDYVRGEGDIFRFQAMANSVQKTVQGIHTQEDIKSTQPPEIEKTTEKTAEYTSLNSDNEDSEEDWDEINDLDSSSIVNIKNQERNDSGIVSTPSKTTPKGWWFW